MPKPREEQSDVCPDTDVAVDELVQSFFDLCRDRVIGGLFFNANGYWTCHVTIPDEAKTFTSKISAMHAFMQALTFITTRKLQGKELYDSHHKKKRAALGL